MNQTLSDELTNLIDTLVDERVGIVKNLFEKTIEADEPPVYIFNAQCCSPLALTGPLDAPARNFVDIHATGCDWSREAALWSTLGEALERYAARCWPQFELASSSYNDYQANALPLHQLIYFSDEQYQRENFRWVRFDPDAKFRWHPGSNLHSGKQVMIPASLLWIDYRCRTREEMFYPQVSTGLACGQERGQVIHGGIREMIERDAFACHWCLSAQPPAVALTPELLKCLPEPIVELLENPNFEINVRWITTDIDVPTIFVLVRSAHHEGTTVGAACHPNAAHAIEKAITEAMHGWKWIKDLRRDSTPVTDKNAVSDFKSHVRYYINDENVDNLKHYYNDDNIELEQRYLEGPVSWQSGIELMCTALEKRGFEAYHADITPDDVADLGFEVGKVIVPGLQPLASGHGNEHYDRRRLDSFACWKGITEPALCEEPHPFP